MAEPTIYMVYSESGGVSKTTTAVSLAVVAANEGNRVLLIDLDPRAATSKWLGIEPKDRGLHVGAILGSDEDTAGFAEELAVQSDWSANLRVIPSARSVSNREADRTDHAELRLARSLIGVDADVVIIDCPNRQGGMLTLSALNASDVVIYAAKPDVDGIDGYIGAKESVERFVSARRAIGAPVRLREFGVIVSGLPNIPPRIARFAIAQLEETGQLVYPIVPERVVVKEMRAVNQWYGDFANGDKVVDAYRQLWHQVAAMEGVPA